jgi:hypothetical protein
MRSMAAPRLLGAALRSVSISRISVFIWVTRFATYARGLAQGSEEALVCDRDL